jgi:hypothetical protein
MCNIKVLHCTVSYIQGREGYKANKFTVHFKHVKDEDQLEGFCDADSRQ